MQGQVVELKERDSGAPRTAHVSQLARFRSDDRNESLRVTSAPEVSTKDEQERIWKKVDKGWVLGRQHQDYLPIGLD